MTVRYRADATVRRFGTTLVGGSPLRVFRLTPAGARLIDRVLDGAAVEPGPLVERLVDAGALHPVSERMATMTEPARVTVVTPTITPIDIADGRIIIDDGAEQPIAGATLRLATNRGPASGRNAGLALAETELVAFVDADVHLDPEWLDPLLGHFDDPRVALVAPRVRSVEGRSLLARYERAASPLDLGERAAPVVPGGRVSYVPAAAIVCRADALRSIGGFDERLRVGEDVDLCWRLYAAGWRCRYEPAAEVTHEPRPGWAQAFTQRVTYGTSAAPLAARHGDAVAPVRLNPWSLAVWALVASGRTTSAVLTSAATSMVLARTLRSIPQPVAAALAARGNLAAGGALAGAVTRGWWPIVAVAAMRSATARRALVASFATRALLPRSTPAWASLVRPIDDVAYSIGVWRGAWRHRSLAALRPAITAWPPRRRTSGRPVRG